MRIAPKTWRLTSCAISLYGFVISPAIADDGSGFQLAREKAAKELALNTHQPVPILIKNQTRQKLEPQSGWKDWLGLYKGDVPLPPLSVDVGVRLKSGEDVVIDTLKASDASELTPITDGSGQTVGYFQVGTADEGGWRVAHGMFAVYIATGTTLVKRTGEVACKKIGDDGIAKITFANALWDNENRELAFDVRSSCYHVDLFGGSAGNRTFNVLTGLFRFEASLSKSHSGADSAKRLVIAIDEDGNFSDFDTATGTANQRRAFRACEKESVTDDFKVCRSAAGERNRAFWKSNGRRIEFDPACNGSDLDSYIAGEGYMALSCSWSYGEKDEYRGMRLELAAAGAPEPVAVILGCKCTALEAKRLSFDANTRTLSFNLDSDTDTVEFEGSDWELAADDATTGSSSILTVEVISVKFNDQWQVVEMASDGRPLDRQASDGPPPPATPQPTEIVPSASVTTVP